MTAVAVWTGAKAEALRQAIRLSQEAFAERLGMSTRTVARWHAQPDVELRAATSDYLDTLLASVDAPARARFGALLDDSNGDQSKLLIASDHRPTPDEAVEADQERWKSTRAYLIDNGIQLAAKASALYDYPPLTSPALALSTPLWTPHRPIPLTDVKLTWNPSPPAPKITGEEPEARTALPLRAPGHAFSRYSAAIRYLRPPTLFENRHSYRLLAADLTGPSPHLEFGLSTFFDKLDVAEPLAHEAAAAEQQSHLGWPSLPFRSLITDPFDLATRPVNPGIATLTIRNDTTTGTKTFPLLRRNPANVTNGRHYSLLPAGEFQPADIAPQSITNDLDLWHNIVREYSEEALGYPEHDGSSSTPIDYQGWRFYRDMTAARDQGTLRIYVLGIALDALTLNATILTAAIIDHEAFDVLFRDLVTANPEGDVIFASTGPNGRSVQRLNFEAATIDSLIRHEPLGQTGAATLALAWHRRRSLFDAQI